MGSEYAHEKLWKNVERHSTIGFSAAIVKEVAEPVSIYYPKPEPKLEPVVAEYLGSRDLSYALARKHGWYGAWHNGPRVVVPCVRTDGYNFWQGRLLEVDSLKRAAHNQFLSSGIETNYKRWDSPRGPRGDALVFLQGGTGYIFGVEGPMCALAINELGHSAVALLGSNPSGPVLAHFAQLIANHSTAFLLPDKDALKFGIKAQSALGAMGAPVTVKTIPGGFKDLAEADKQIRADIVGAMVGDS